MTPTCSTAGRRRPAGVAGLLAAGLLLALPGCVPAAAMMAANVVSSVAGAAVGGGSGQAAGGRSLRPGTGVQNGRHVDESIGQALALSRSEPLGICRAALPEVEPLPAGQCGLRPVCLPGAKRPTELQVCNMASGGDAPASSSSPQDTASARLASDLSAAP